MIKIKMIIDKKKKNMEKTGFTDAKNLPMIMSLNVYKSGLLPHYSLRHLYVSSINNITIAFCELYFKQYMSPPILIFPLRKFKTF